MASTSRVLWEKCPVDSRVIDAKVISTVGCVAGLQ
jgi:hypothetical protein